MVSDVGFRSRPPSLKRGHGRPRGGEATTWGSEWKIDDNWLTDAPLKDWYGVVVDDDGRVARLDLADNYLGGHLPPELEQLSQLKWLNLAGNHSLGDLPPELGQLSQVTDGYLFHNRLSGCIPPLGPGNWHVNFQYRWDAESKNGWSTSSTPAE